MIPTDKDIADGIRRIALTPDGLLLYRRLQVILMDVSPSTDPGALLKNEGRRSLARELKLLMDEELAKVGIASDRPGSAHDPDSPAIGSTARAVARRAARGSERRVADDDTA